ncbi:chemotaxis protein CheW [Plastorhodobacter daqingensis]|uniref:Chemotaxis protein CheW n=1 Tax=Plastorhodobacter daqingensis TaxID=1387281 RepID=A0ABW2UQM1_9RHOB
MQVSSAMMPRDMVQGGQVVIFAAGSALYALPVHQVQEILDLQPIVPLPNAPAHLLGLTDLRGTGIAVVDLRKLLQLDPVNDSAQTRILVCVTGQPDNQRLVGLRTERVIEVSAFDEERVQTLHEADLMHCTDIAVAGVGRRNGGFVALLDLERLFDPARMTAALASSLPDAG